jgi:hypothetical protein
VKDDFESVESAPASLSKRGARRVIQRAFVLMGRDRALRQKLRGTELATRWRVEDWDLEWTAVMAGGRFEFFRGQTGRAPVNIHWERGEDFLAQVRHGGTSFAGFSYHCDAAARRPLELVIQSFLTTLRRVLQNPIDDDGVRLI